MTQQDDITQSVHKKINEIIAKHFNDDPAGAVRAQIAVHEVLSKLRAPVADERDRNATISQVVGLCNRIPGATTWNAAQFMYDEMHRRAALASAPVAGEQIIAWDVQDTGLGRRYTTYNPKVAEDLMNLGENVRPLVYASALPPANAAPQASAEDVRELPDAEMRTLIGNYFADDWAKEAAAGLLHDYARALKTQADKDGGQQRAGDVDERAAFEAWAYRAGMGPKFRESMFAAWEARAALSAPQAEQGERG
ncbi:hypothetical protein [Achromobacter dolens]|uniref:hypothetical protein n=1 Tax=Achromobacter dolens TaxID=1287738 RepID=UPI00300CE419